MFFAMTWILVLAFLAIWSAVVSGVHALVLWSLAGVGGLVDQPQHMATLPGWIAVWVPPDWDLAFKAITEAVLPMVESALSALPSAAQWLTPLAWMSWGIGVLVLVGAGLAVTALISLTRRAAAHWHIAALGDFSVTKGWCWRNWRPGARTVHILSAPMTKLLPRYL